MKTWRVIIQRHPGDEFWLIYVPELDRYTQALASEGLEEVVEMAAGLIEAVDREPGDLDWGVWDVSQELDITTDPGTDIAAEAE